MPLNIIGAGLGRTGTMSLKVAIEQLGLGPCYHMVEVWANVQCTADWVEAANGHPDWERLFKGYSATVDYPGCHFWRELTAVYPQAKVILTVRDPDEWFESTQATIFSPGMRALLAQSPVKEFITKTVLDEFGDGIDDRARMVAAFEKHVADVKKAIPKGRLLVFEVSQGWKPLCDFLDVPVPSTPFPRLNSREEMAAMMAAARAQEGARADWMSARAKEFVQRPLKH
jgi:hypothetical protein